MGEPEKRKRDHRKAVSFSAEEWEQVQRRMELAGARSFEGFARSVILTARVEVRRSTFDPTPFRATVYVTSAALDARSLKVAAFRQSGGRAVPVTEEDNRRLEDAILTRARQIRIAGTQ